MAGVTGGDRLHTEDAKGTRSRGGEAGPARAWSWVKEQGWVKVLAWAGRESGRFAAFP